MRGIGNVRSAAALYAAALVLAMGPLNTAQAQAVAAAPVAAAASEPSHGDLLWKAARKGDWAAFDQTLAKIAADGQANAGLAEAATTFQKHIAKREEDRAKRLGEVRDELKKALTGDITDISLGKALRAATELELLSLDKAAVKTDPQIVELVGRSIKAAHAAESRGDVFAAYELLGVAPQGQIFQPHAYRLIGFTQARRHPQVQLLKQGFQALLGAEGAGREWRDGGEEQALLVVGLNFPPGAERPAKELDLAQHPIQPGQREIGKFHHAQRLRRRQQGFRVRRFKQERVGDSGL
jgi:hypothetical protein